MNDAKAVFTGPLSCLENQDFSCFHISSTIFEIFFTHAVNSM